MEQTYRRYDGRIVVLERKQKVEFDRKALLVVAIYYCPPRMAWAISMKGIM
jgi:hypothetical protein